MGKMIDWFKTHPLAAGLIVFGVGLILVLSLFGKSDGGGTTVVAAPSSDVGQGTALQVAQLNAGVQIATAQMQANVQSQAIGAALEAQKSSDATTVTGIVTQADTSKYISTLQAQNDAAAIQASKDINASQMSAAQQIAMIQAGADTTIAALTADSNNKQTAAAVTIAGLSVGVQSHAIDMAAASHNFDSQLAFDYANLDNARAYASQNFATQLTFEQLTRYGALPVAA